MPLGKLRLDSCWILVLLWDFRVLSKETLTSSQAELGTKPLTLEFVDNCSTSLTIAASKLT